METVQGVYPSVPSLTILEIDEGADRLHQLNSFSYTHLGLDESTSTMINAYKSRLLQYLTLAAKTEKPWTV